MGEIFLTEPTREFLEQIAEYRKEFLEAGDSMDGTSGLRRYEKPEDWILWVENARNWETCPEGWVPDIQYLSVRRSDRKIVGMLDIRLDTTPDILLLHGMIGYSIRKSERKKKFGIRQLELGLQICKERGMKQVLITCDKSNYASAATIKANGGILENEVVSPETGEMIQRYWITLE